MKDLRKKEGEAKVNLISQIIQLKALISSDHLNALASVFTSFLSAS